MYEIKLDWAALFDTLAMGIPSLAAKICYFVIFGEIVPAVGPLVVLDDPAKEVKKLYDRVDAKKNN